MPSFVAPEGWEIPADAVPGTPFQAVGTFTMDEEGNITITEIDGSPIAGYEEEVEAAPEGETEMEAMMGRAQQAGMLG